MNIEHNPKYVFHVLSRAPKGATCAARIRIPETLVWEHGSLSSWLHYSNHTNEVVRKDRRECSTDMIYEVLGLEGAQVEASLRASAVSTMLQGGYNVNFPDVPVAVLLSERDVIPGFVPGDPRKDPLNHKLRKDSRRRTALAGGGGRGSRKFNIPLELIEEDDDSSDVDSVDSQRENGGVSFPKSVIAETFLDRSGLDTFLAGNDLKHRTLLQKYPLGRSLHATVVEAVYTPQAIFITQRQNKRFLSDTSVSLYDRCCTSETTPHLVETIQISHTAKGMVERDIKAIADHIYAVEKKCVSRMVAYFSFETVDEEVAHLSGEKKGSIHPLLLWVSELHMSRKSDIPKEAIKRSLAQNFDRPLVELQPEMAAGIPIGPGQRKQRGEYLLDKQKYLPHAARVGAPSIAEGRGGTDRLLASLKDERYNHMCATLARFRTSEQRQAHQFQLSQQRNQRQQQQQQQQQNSTPGWKGVKNNNNNNNSRFSSSSSPKNNRSSSSSPNSPFHYHPDHSQNHNDNNNNSNSPTNASWSQSPFAHLLHHSNPKSKSSTESNVKKIIVGGHLGAGQVSRLLTPEPKKQQHQGQVYVSPDAKFRHPPHLTHHQQQEEQQGYEGEQEAEEEHHRRNNHHHPYRTNRRTVSTPQPSASLIQQFIDRSNKASNVNSPNPVKMLKKLQREAAKPISHQNQQQQQQQQQQQHELRNDNDYQLGTTTQFHDSNDLFTESSSCSSSPPPPPVEQSNIFTPTKGENEQQQQDDEDYDDEMEEGKKRGRKATTRPSFVDDHGEEGQHQHQEEQRDESPKAGAGGTTRPNSASQPDSSSNSARSGLPPLRRGSGSFSAHIASKHDADIVDLRPLKRRDSSHAELEAVLAAAVRQASSNNNNSSRGSKDGSTPRNSFGKKPVESLEDEDDEDDDDEEAFEEVEEESDSNNRTGSTNMSLSLSNNSSQQQNHNNNQSSSGSGRNHSSSSGRTGRPRSGSARPTKKKRINRIRFGEAEPPTNDSDLFCTLSGARLQAKAKQLMSSIHAPSWMKCLSPDVNLYLHQQLSSLDAGYEWLTHLAYCFENGAKRADEEQKAMIFKHGGGAKGDMKQRDLPDVPVVVDLQPFPPPPAPRKCPLTLQEITVGAPKIYLFTAWKMILFPGSAIPNEKKVHHFQAPSSSPWRGSSSKHHHQAKRRNSSVSPSSSSSSSSLQTHGEPMTPARAAALAARGGISPRRRSSIQLATVTMFSQQDGDVLGSGSHHQHNHQHNNINNSPPAATAAASSPNSNNPSTTSAPTPSNSSSSLSAAVSMAAGGPLLPTTTANHSISASPSDVSSTTSPTNQHHQLPKRKKPFKTLIRQQDLQITEYQKPYSIESNTIVAALGSATGKEIQSVSVNVDAWTLSDVDKELDKTRAARLLDTPVMHLTAAQMLNMPYIVHKFGVFSPRSNNFCVPVPVGNLHNSVVCPNARDARERADALRQLARIAITTQRYILFETIGIALRKAASFSRKMHLSAITAEAQLSGSDPIDAGKKRSGAFMAAAVRLFRGNNANRKGTGGKGDEEDEADVGGRKSGAVSVLTDPGRLIRRFFSEVPCALSAPATWGVQELVELQLRFSGGDAMDQLPPSLVEKIKAASASSSSPSNNNKSGDSKEVSARSALSAASNAMNRRKSAHDVFIPAKPEEVSPIAEKLEAACNEFTFDLKAEVVKMLRISCMPNYLADIPPDVSEELRLLDTTSKIKRGSSRSRLNSDQQQDMCAAAVRVINEESNAVRLRRQNPALLPVNAAVEDWPPRMVLRPDVIPEGLC